MVGKLGGLIKWHVSLERNKQTISIRIRPCKQVRACSVPGIMGEAGVKVTLPSGRARGTEDTGHAPDLLDKY